MSEEFIQICGKLNHVTITSSLDESSTSDECVKAFASFLLSMGYHVENVRDSLEAVAGEL